MQNFADVNRALGQLNDRLDLILELVKLKNSQNAAPKIKHD